MDHFVELVLMIVVVSAVSVVEMIVVGVGIVCRLWKMDLMIFRMIRNWQMDHFVGVVNQVVELVEVVVVVVLVAVVADCQEQYYLRNYLLLGRQSR